MAMQAIGISFSKIVLLSGAAYLLASIMATNGQLADILGRLQIVRTVVQRIMFFFNLGATRGSTPQPPDFEAKVAKLTELGFGRDAVIRALHFSTEMRSRLLVIEEIVKYEWSARWQSFVPDLVSAAKTSETICKNWMAILKVTSISISLSR
ncbi:hypothetical protein Syun_014776 [Stephania yunnanensis]|uniref:Exportin-1/Importin-beta-like domain-containing protein n=1 Tax=Stephania yunnanensis TaxID=152371 RepID=A0AAP0PC90_9MAGN